MKARACAECGAQFQPPHHRVTVCSDECRAVRARRYQRTTYARSKKTLDPKQCDVCGDEFVPKHGNSTLCSDVCRRKRRVERTRAWRVANPPAPWHWAEHDRYLHAYRPPFEDSGGMAFVMQMRTSLGVELAQGEAAARSILSSRTPVGTHVREVPFAADLLALDAACVKAVESEAKRREKEAEERRVAVWA